MHLMQHPEVFIRNDIKIPIDKQKSNLPFLNHSVCTKKELDVIGPHFKSTMVLFDYNWVFNDYWNVEVDEFKYEFDSYFKMYYPCVWIEKNEPY